MYCTGIDIVEIWRIERAIARWGEHFLSRVYTPAELDLCHHRIPALASRFAAKEAVMKALGTGTKGIGWQDIEITPNNDGKPLVYLHGRAQNKAKELGLIQFSISLSHSREYAIASVIGET